MYLKSLLNILIICFILLVNTTNHQQLDRQSLLVTFTKHDRNSNQILEQIEIESLIKQVIDEYMQHIKGKNQDIDTYFIIESIRQEAKMYDRKRDGLDFKEYFMFVKSMVDTEL